MSTAGNWIEISVQADPLLLEELSPGFFKMGCQGINEYPQKFILYFQNALWDDVKKAELAGILDKMPGLIHRLIALHILFPGFTAQLGLEIDNQRRAVVDRNRIQGMPLGIDGSGR